MNVSAYFNLAYKPQCVSMLLGFLISDLPVSSFSIFGNADLDCVVLLPHNVAPLLCNWLRNKFTLETNVDLLAI